MHICGMVSCESHVGGFLIRTARRRAMSSSAVVVGYEACGERCEAEVGEVGGASFLVARGGS